ncbi:hypothetical protein TNCV_3499991 [Trichonephila clavipes]|nr:hypothetical protein TNCV_3499991 [Trichonephila clavipes]
MRSTGIAVSDADCGAVGTGRRAVSPLVWLVEEKERWVTPGHPQGFLPLNWDGTEQSCSVTCMVLKAKSCSHTHASFPPTSLGRQDNEEVTSGKVAYKSINSRPNSPVASTSNDGVIRCPVCEEEYCDPPAEVWIQCCKY